MSRRRARLFVFAFTLVMASALVLWAFVGLGRDGDAAVDRKQTPAPAPAPGSESELRLVTLAPALTQLLTDLNLGDAIVGVAEHDTLAPPAARVVGTYYDVNLEALLTIRPTHVLTLTSLSDPPAVLRGLASQGRFRLVNFDYPDTLAQVADLIAPPPPEVPSATPSEDAVDTDVAVDHSPAPTPHGPTLAELFPQSNAPELRETMLAQMRALLDLTHAATQDQGTPGQDTQAPRVLLLIGTHPLMASGPNTVLDDMLRYAGGRNAVHDATVGAPTISQERLVGINPDVILLLDPLGPPLRGVDDDPRLAELRGLALRAVENHRVHLIADPLAVLPGASLTRIAATMAKLVHPELSDAIDRVLPAAGDPQK